MKRKSMQMIALATLALVILSQMLHPIPAFAEGISTQSPIEQFKTKYKFEFKTVPPITKINSEQSTKKQPIYGSPNDKACTTAYIELEYAMQRRIVIAKTDISSIYFTVASLAAQTINDTLYNADSNIYGKIGLEEYKLSLNYLFGKNTDTDSDSFKTGMKYIKRYFLQKSHKACDALYDDLTAFGYIDKNGELDLSIGEFTKKTGLSKGAVYAILEEICLYLDEPLDGLKR